MNTSIDSLLSSQRDPSTMFERALPTRRDANGQSFTELLMEGFRARAAQRGIELPVASDTSPNDASSASTAADEWKQAQLRSVAAGNGPGDAMLKMLAEASAARYERRHRPPGMFDFLTST